jgi:hypothetical protein
MSRLLLFSEGDKRIELVSSGLTIAIQDQGGAENSNSVGPDKIPKSAENDPSE